MFKFYKKALLVFLFIGLGYCAYGQEDYFITQKGDTVKCTLRERFFEGKRLKYTTPQSPQEKIIFLDTIYEYSINQTINTRRTLAGDSTQTFIMWIERGKADLFERLITSDKYTYRAYFVGKEHDKVDEIKTNQILGSQKKRKDRLYAALADYPELVDKFNAAGNYSFDAIRAVIKEYNNFYADNKSYFITLKGDTINCKIAERIAAATSKDSIAYKTATATRFKALDLDTVKEYIFKDQKFTRKVLPGQTGTKFVTLQEGGKINFYQYTDPNTKKSWYASKGLGPLLLVKGKGPSKVQLQNLNGLIADYPELVEQLSGITDYNELAIRATISAYNRIKKN